MHIERWAGYVPRKSSQIMKFSDVRFEKRAPAFSERKQRRTRAQQLGRIYETQALRFLQDTYPRLITLPWLRYTVEGERNYRWCQLDGLLIDLISGHIIIIECKLKHTAAAFEKLESLYLPLVRKLFPEHLWKVSALEFTRTFDCAVKVSVPLIIYKSIDHIYPHQNPDEAETFGVVVWEPKKKLH